MPLNALASEIDELAQRLARLVGAGSSLERHRRVEIRALLREVFLTTQDDRGLETLLPIRDSLLELWTDLNGEPGFDLSERVLRHDAFGAVDRALVERNEGFSTRSMRQADDLAGTIHERIKRTLNALSDGNDNNEEEEAGRALQTQEERKELITSRLP